MGRKVTRGNNLTHNCSIVILMNVKNGLFKYIEGTTLLFEKL